MSQSLARILVHIVFSTKNREPLIDKVQVNAVKAYTSVVLENLRCPSLQVGGVADHLHVLLSQSRTRTLADTVEEVKKATSKWMKRQGVPDFWWQTGYAAFSVGQDEAERVVRYIKSQEQHHRDVSFQDELRDLLRYHQVTYDEAHL